MTVSYNKNVPWDRSEYMTFASWNAWNPGKWVIIIGSDMKGRGKLGCHKKEAFDILKGDVIYCPT